MIVLNGLVGVIPLLNTTGRLHSHAAHTLIYVIYIVIYIYLQYICTNVYTMYVYVIYMYMKLKMHL